MTKEQIIRLAGLGYTALVRGNRDILFTPVKGSEDEIVRNADFTPFSEDEIIFLVDALVMDEGSLENFGEIRTPMRVLVPA